MDWDPRHQNLVVKEKGVEWEGSVIPNFIYKINARLLLVAYRKQSVATCSFVSMSEIKDFLFVDARDGFNTLPKIYPGTVASIHALSLH